MAMKVAAPQLPLVHSRLSPPKKIPAQLQSSPSLIEGGGSSPEGHDDIIVAIKVLKETVSAKLWEDFRKELRVLKRVKGPSIVEFHGLVLRPRWAVVMEFCARGSLYHALTRTDWQCGWDQFFDIVSQCIRSVSSLHHRQDQIVHRDLKTLNFLVTQDWEVKMADFGLSRQTNADEPMEGGAGSGIINTLSTLNACRGTYCYTAPEVYRRQTYTDKADVFSLGVIIWEVLVRTMKGVYERPYGDTRYQLDFQVLLAVANKGVRPTMPAGVPERLEAMLKDCWLDDPKERKPTEVVLRLLNMARSEYKQNKEVWDALRKEKPAGGSSIEDKKN